MPRTADLDEIRKVPPFDRLADSACARLMRHAFVHRLPKGSVLFEQGEQPGFLHVVIDGKVGLIGEAADRREAVVEVFARGEVLIAPAVILDLPYLMSARVVEAARVAMIPAAEFRALLDSDAALASAMARVLARHWRILVRQIKELKLKSATQRVGAYLLALLDAADGPQTIHLSEDRRTVASRLGMTPESLSRAFAQLRAIGVGGRGRSVTVADPARLRALCGDDGLD